MSENPSNPASASPSLRRRPIRARDTRWAHRTAAALTRMGVRPNQISVFSAVCALAGAGAFLEVSHTGETSLRVVLLMLAAGGIQSRLLCNLFDGLVAVEGGLRTKSGEIYNELPDRVSDVLLFAAAGYATFWSGWEHELGWVVAALAVIVAYVRALGGQMGAAQQFGGPMAKQQRMFTLTLACAATAVECLLGVQTRSMTLALAIIAAGSVLTAILRVRRIALEVESR